MHNLLQLFICARFALLPLVKCSSAFQLKPAKDTAGVKGQAGDSEKAYDIAVHGILLWASTAFLMPLGILAIRCSIKHELQGPRFKPFLYLHALLQVCSVIIATAGAVLSIRKFENSFDNSHQRVGLALYAAIYVQLFSACRRPTRGSKSRCIWYIFHWILGTAISLVGIFNTFTGLRAYRRKTSKSATLWTILFTAQVCFMAFLYLFQDKWDYVQKQGVKLSGDAEEPAIPNSGRVNTETEPHRKSNALGTYFSRSNALNKLFQLT